MPALFAKVMKITIGNIVLWERLAGRSFSTFAPTNAEDMTLLLYVVDSPDCSAETYANALEATKSSELTKKVKGVAKAIEKFLQYATKEANVPEAGEEEDKQLMGDTVGQVIFSGQPAPGILALSIDYLPFPHSFSIVAVLESEQYVAKTKRDEERDRRNLYTQLSPYLSAGTSLHSFWPLPWDAEAEISDEDADIAKFLFSHNKISN